MRATSILLVALIYSLTLPVQAQEAYTLKGLRLGMSKSQVAKKYDIKCRREALDFGADEICQVATTLAGHNGSLFVKLKSGVVDGLNVTIDANDEETFHALVSMGTEKYGAPDESDAEQASWYGKKALFGVARSGDSHDISVMLLTPIQKISDDL